MVVRHAPGARCESVIPSKSSFSVAVSSFVSAEFHRTPHPKVVRRRCWNFLKIVEPVLSRNRSLVLTPLELDVMKAVWDNSPITVKSVQHAIRPFRPLAYTTVLTVMHRLYRKGFLRRSLKSRTHHYEPAVTFADVRDAAVTGVIQHFFHGSRDRLLDHLGAEPVPAASPVTPARLDETLL